MGEVTGWLSQHQPKGREWKIIAPFWMKELRSPWGQSHGVGSGIWYFRRRIDAVAFAARKGIRLEAE